MKQKIEGGKEKKCKKCNLPFKHIHDGDRGIFFPGGVELDPLSDRLMLEALGVTKKPKQND